MQKAEFLEAMKGFVDVHRISGMEIKDEFVPYVDLYNLFTSDGKPNSFADISSVEKLTAGERTNEFILKTLNSTNPKYKAVLYLILPSLKIEDMTFDETRHHAVFRLGITFTGLRTCYDYLILKGLFSGCLDCIEIMIASSANRLITINKEELGELMLFKRLKESEKNDDKSSNIVFTRFLTTAETIDSAINMSESIFQMFIKVKEEFAAGLGW